MVGAIGRETPERIEQAVDLGLRVPVGKPRPARSASSNRSPQDFNWAGSVELRVNRDGDEREVGTEPIAQQVLHPLELETQHRASRRAAGEDELDGRHAAADHLAGEPDGPALLVDERDVHTEALILLRDGVLHERRSWQLGRYQVRVACSTRVSRRTVNLDRVTTWVADHDGGRCGAAATDRRNRPPGCEQHDREARG